MFGGPKFLVKMLPVNKLNSRFLYDQIHLTVEAVKESNGNAKTILACDGNRTNQAFLKKFDTFPEKPWLTTNGTYLLFDFVHLIKNIRNNWLTEKKGELIFYENGVEKTACWSHLIKLFEADSNCLMKLSDLNEVSVRPSHIERQSVSTCLKVFSEKTYSALLNHPETSNILNINETADFIKMVVTWWKILNVKSVGVDCRFNDDRKAVIRDPNDDRLKFIWDFEEMALRMTSNQGKRIKQLTHDTGYSINHTCKGIVELTKTLLKEKHKYVMLGKLTTDPLEKEFSKLRQGFGGTYFLSVQQIIEKFNISKTSLLLSYNINESTPDAGHSCQFCGFLLDESSAEVFDNLPTLEKSITVQSKMSLVYIAGYVSRNEPEQCFILKSLVNI
nr:uncharacterized protein LOC105847471 isoform X2 [Hydra vulgaris]